MTRMAERLWPWLDIPGSLLRLRLTKLALLISDGLMFVLAGLIATVVSMSISPAESWQQWIGTQALQRYFAWGGIVLLTMLLFLGRYQHYTDRKPFWTELSEILTNLFWLGMLDIAILSITRWNASRSWWLVAWLSAMALIPTSRFFLRRLMMARGVWQRPTVLIGNGSNAIDAVHAMRSEPQMGFEFVGCIDALATLESSTASLDETASTQLQALGVTAMGLKAFQRLREHAGLQVVIALEYDQTPLREQWLRQMAQWKVQDVCVIPAMRGIPLYGTDISSFFSHEVALLRLRNNLRRWPARLTKRLFDIVVASLILLVLALPMIWLAMRIRADGGPALFSHLRVGRGGKIFPCLKFRSMIVDAEQRLATLLVAQPQLRTQWEQERKLRNDPRISQIGAFLRSTSLDELPQLINVIRGEMSLVGPRPIVEDELQKYGDDADYFLMVRPGITGLWQVSGRSDADYNTRVYLDTWYVKNWSLWYDIAILFKTVKVVLRRDGAY